MAAEEEPSWLEPLRQGHEIVLVGSADAAQAQLAARTFAAVVAESALGGVDFLAWCREHHPSVRRVLLAAYDSLPSIMLAEGRSAIEHLVPKPPHPASLAKLLNELVADAPVTSAPMPGYALLVKTVRALVAERGVVIRHLPRDGETTQLQLVLPNNAATEDMRVRMPIDWGWPVKPKGARTTRKHRAHPIVKSFGGYLSEDQELYVQTLDDGLCVYMAFLPWARRPDVTVAIGFAGSDAAAANEELASLHDLAVTETLEFPLPAPTAGPFLAAGYDWVVTRDYVGPDRRGRETSFANRYMFIGRRRTRLANLPQAMMPFVDQLTTEAALLGIAYLAFSAFDTLATLWFVSRGTFAELNPILRPLVAPHPWQFLLAKNLCSMTALVIMVRFHLLRAARVVLWLNAAAYAGLVVYWLHLMWRVGALSRFGLMPP